MTKPMVLVTEMYALEALSQLEKYAKVQTLTSGEKLEIYLPETEVLMVRSRTRIDERLLNLAPKLKVVITATSGFDHIDYELCQKRNVQVAYTPEANAASAAELTMSLILNLTRHVPLASQTVQQNKWRDQVPRGVQLKGLSLGIVGLGRVGKKVAELGRAFGMTILACDPYIEPTEFSAHKAEAMALSEILLAADVLSLHTPLTKETKHMINRATLSNMNSEAFLINTARGELVNEMELVKALDEGQLKGAALDVFEKEPLPADSKIKNRKNLLLTPHLGAYTEQAVRAASLQAVENAVEFFKSGRIFSPLPVQAPWFKLTHGF